MKGKEALKSARRRVEDLGLEVSELTERLQVETQARIKAERTGLDRDVLAREVVRLRELNEAGSSDALVKAKKAEQLAVRNLGRVLIALAKRDKVEEAMMQVLRKHESGKTEAFEAVLTELRGVDTLILSESPTADPESPHSSMIERKRRKKAVRNLNSASRPRRS